MNQKTISKILATMLVITLTFANIILLGVYAGESYATSDNLEKQGTATNNENVEFDAYFVNSENISAHSVKQDINAQDTRMYVSVKVKKGYLKDAKVQIFGEEEDQIANFEMLNSNESLELIQSIDTDNNLISLKQINKDTEAVLQIPITANKDNKFDLSNFSKENRIKLTASYVNDEGKTISVQKTIKARVEWTGTASVTVEQSVERYIPFTVNETKGLLLQTIVKTGLENNNLPIEETNINVTVPVVNGIKPIKVNVTANSTLATNGADALKFNSENYKYNQETGILNIAVKNDVQNNVVSWNKNCKDEYVITYVYPEEAVTETGIQTEQTVNAKIKAYNNVATQVENTVTGKIEASEKIGEIVTGKITTLNESLSKGYLYTKSDRETEYKIEDIVDIGYSEIVDKIVVDSEVDNFINENGEANSTIDSTYYKSTSVNKENFDKVLGTEGYIKILDKDGATLATFNKDAKIDENGNYTYNYVAETNKITIQTSKPIAEGNLKITHAKSLKGNTEYSKAQLESFKVLKSDINTSASLTDTVISTNKSSVEMNLIDPSTQVEVSVSKTNLSTVVKNENVEIRTILKTNNITCDLYKNPVVEIVLPSYIESIQIKDINLLFDDELKINNYETYKNSEGNTVIKVIIKGEDTKYNTDELSKGANLVINTDITLKQLTPTKQDTVKVYVTNENATTHNVKTSSTSVPTAYAETELNSVAPVGMVTTNTITGFNLKNETVTSISGQEQTGKLETKTEARNATVSMNVINNYSNSVKNVNILGRLPFEGNKDIVSGSDLGSNITTTLNGVITSSGIDANKVTIYYSENALATKDITLESNGWTTSATNTVKSYLIVLNDYEMKTGDVLTFTYNINIPADLSHNRSMYTNYVVYFDNLIDGETVQDKAVATKVGLTTGEGPELEVTIEADVENGTEVQEGQIITYTAKVRNVGKSAVQNVTLAGAVPEGSVYTYYEGKEETELGITQMYDEEKKVYSEVIDSLEPEESEEIKYSAKVSSLTYDEDNQLNETTLEVQAQAKAEGSDTLFTSDKLESGVTEGFITAKLTTEPLPATVDRREEEEITYVLSIDNANEKEKNNVVITYELPEGLTYISSSDSGEYNNNTVTWSIEKLEGNESKTIALKVKANKLGNEYKKVIDSIMTIKAEEKTVQSNKLSITVTKPGLRINQTSDINTSTVSVGETITYTAVIENIGVGNAINVKVIDNIPEGLEITSVKCTYKGLNSENKYKMENVNLPISIIEGGEKAEVNIKAKVKELNSGENQREISNIIKVSLNGEEIESNKITHTIISSGGTNNDPSTGGETQKGTYAISGTAWLDSNNDGKRDETESTLGGISVILINAENGQIVKDITTGQNKVQETNEDGEYVFANLQSGKYMVVYLYDAGNYGITAYQKEGVADNLNSDAIAMKINLHDEIMNAAVTNTIEIKDSNVRNIDVGLIISPKFDLKLEKVISKITVTDSNGTKENEYKDSNLVKLDLNPKTINSTSIIVEYKIKVTNEGGVAGYAKKIVDYIPQDMKFSSELNKEWYSADNGNIYNSSLANTLIQPGETKEITLLLTKKMNDNNVGIINNIAEIYEASNDLGLVDIDSTPANKVQNEDDMSSADAIIGIKTGQIYVYITITLITISILGAGIYLINKKVLKRI